MHEKGSCQRTKSSHPVSQQVCPYFFTTYATSASAMIIADADADANIRNIPGTFISFKNVNQSSYL